MLTRNFNELQRLVAGDVANERIVQGSYWNHEKQHGCFIGCLTRDRDPAIAERQWGIPVMLQQIAENIFENLPADEARQFFADLPAAIGCDGKDLALVSWQFLAAELRALPPQPAEIQADIDPVIAGMDLLAAGREWPGAPCSISPAWNASLTGGTHTVAARSAAWSALAAARSVPCARHGRHAAHAAAWSVHTAAIDRAARRRQRDTLLRLITNAPKADADS